MVSQIPLIGTLYQLWCQRCERQELNTITLNFEKLIQSPDEAAASSLKDKTVALLEHGKERPEFKSELGKLERVYFVYLSKTTKTLPSTYLAKENCALVDLFAKCGISREFLLKNPEFLSIAKEHFWHHYFPFVNLNVKMIGDELYIPFETEENTRNYSFKPWKEIKELNLANFRVTYEGFAIGHPDQSNHLVPLKMVDSSDKYALQFVTSCPVGRRLPSSIDFTASGHSFTQIILPKESSGKSEVYSVGYYPRKIADFGLQFFKTVPGVYRNHDSNVSRIQAKQVTPIVKQYLFLDDEAESPCLFSLVQNMDAICEAFKQKNVSFQAITMKDVEKAIVERNEPELDRILIALTEVRKQIVKKELIVPITAMKRKEKAQLVMRRFEEAQGKHSYHMLGSNCTAVSFQQEAFAVAFLDVKLDSDKAVQVYDTQVDIRDHRFGILDRIREVLERTLLHLFAALPLTGPLMGIGSTHPDAAHLKVKRLVPSVLSETAFATHQLLTASFNPRPLFPAGEILAQNTPVIEPPGFFTRLKYLFKRHSLLT